MPSNSPQPGYFEREMNRAAAAQAVWHSGNPQHMSPAEICNIAADAAVDSDRKRMSEMLRSRVLHTTLQSLPPRVSMKVEEIMFQLADQIATGMYYDPSGDVPDIPDSPPEM